MLSDGLNYPIRGDNGIVRMLIGGVLNFLGFLIFPAFLLTGYFIEVGASSSNGVDEPVEFEDWGDLLVKGLVGTVIGLVYSIVPFLILGALMFVAFSIGVVGGSAESGAVAGVGIVSFLVVMLLSIPVSLLIVYTVPAGLIAYGRNDSIGAAFDLDELGEVLMSGDYLAAAIMPILISIALQVVITVLAITFVGLVLVPFISFYASVAIFRMFGTAYGKVKGTSPATSPEPTAEPA